MTAQAQHVDLLSRSTLFDAEWYGMQYPDVALLGLQPAEHYLRYGARLLRDPSPRFSTRQYLEANPDVAAAGVNALVHYLEHGRNENRSLAPHTATPNLYAEAVDVVVPVFNALEDVKKCLEAVRTRKDGFIVRCIVVNDGSNEETGEWLRRFSAEHEDTFALIEHPKNLGYTKAVNTGLRASKAPYVITLNSDTIVTRGWLRGLVRCMHSDPTVGIVGPLSNAASWQNVPALYDASGAFAVNELPSGMTADDMAAVVASASRRAYPRMPFVNGFCFMIKRAVIDTVGYMDDENFPVGYGEENDFCIRAADAGFALAIADDTYVFHAKSKSFGHDRRKALSQGASEKLRSKHGREKFDELVRRVREDAKVLDATRERFRVSLEEQRHRCDAVLGKKARLSRSVTTDMHGTQIALMPTPCYGTSDYEVDPVISGPLLVLRHDGNGSTITGREAPSLGLHLHLHYEDLFDEFIEFLKNIPFSFSLYISVTNEGSVPAVKSRAKVIRNANVVVRYVENRGRDIASFVVEFAKELVQHEFVCHIHSKRSPHNRNKADWRRQLLVNLLGSERFVKEIFSLFADNPLLGMVFPEYHHSLRGQISWGSNFAVCKTLALRLGIDISDTELVLFPAGSMFWARKAALAKLFDAGMTADDFPPEAGQVDGTTAHAVERLFGEIAVQAGFDLLQVKSDKQHSLISYYPHKWPYRPGITDEKMAQQIRGYQTHRPGVARSVAVYTALTGSYDQPVIHESLDGRIDYLMFTDSPVDDRGFLKVKSIGRAGLSNVRRARFVKTNPLRFLPDYQIAVWIDANVVIRRDIWKYVQMALDNPETPLFGIPHPQRDCAYAEAEAVVSSNKDTSEMVEKQMRHYRKEGFPARSGLIETNFMVINMRHKITRSLFDEWSSQIDRFSHRDQLSLNYAIWKTGAVWRPLFGEKQSLRDSFDFAYLGHGKNSGYPQIIHVPGSSVTAPAVGIRHEVNHAS